MKQEIKIVSITVVASFIILVIVNQILWAKSYSYACWRVTHPFGSNVQAFGKVVHSTTPEHIPILIAKVDGSDGYWISSIFKAWFPEARPPETKKQEYWSQWWNDHRSEHNTKLVLHHDPQF